MATGGGIGSKAEVLSPTSLGDANLRLLRFELSEALSQPFELRLELASENKALDTGAALGQPLGAKITMADGTVRHLHGRIASAALVGSLRSDLYRYEAVVRPGFWFLRFTRHSRVFQKEDIVSIVKTVLQPAASIGVSVDVKAQKTYPKRPYCVQYNESDFDFVTRLLEQEGAYYFFEHAAGSHSMVLADSAKAHQPLVASATLDYLPGASKAATDLEGVLEWVARDHAGSSKFTLRDFDFERVTTKLEAAARVASTTKGPSGLEVERYGEGYRFEGADKGAAKTDPDAQAKHIAAVLAAQRDASARQIDGATDALGMACGHTFEIDKLPVAAQNGKYLCTRTNLAYQQGHGDLPGNEVTSYACTFGAQLVTRPFRAERSVPWPRMHGPQTAIVIGSGEIDPDEYGRVKVRFHWGPDDARSSAWVRVATPMASKGFGMIALPRVGDEVVVDFLEGDPDQPLITGSVWNAQNMPPYTLKERKTVVGLRTRSSEGGSADNFNELRFDDKKGDEHVWLQAEKIFHRHVKNDAFDVVGQDEHVKITRDHFGEIGRDWQVSIGQHAVLKIAGDTQVDIAKDTIVSIGAKLDATVTGDVTAKSNGNGQLTFAQNLDIDAGTNVALTAGANVHVKGASIVIEGASQMTLKAGAGTITLGPGGVTIDGPFVKINCGGAGSVAQAAKKASPVKPKAPKAPTAQKDPLKP